MAQKNGSYYKGDVSHFTYWNCDLPNALVNFKIQVLNTALQPLTGVVVSVMINGFNNPPFTAYTNNDGNVNMMVPANAPLLVKAGAACNLAAYSTNMISTNADIDLGSIQIDVQQYGATFTGNVK